MKPYKLAIATHAALAAAGAQPGAHNVVRDMLRDNFSHLPPKGYNKKRSAGVYQMLRRLAENKRKNST